MQGIREEREHPVALGVAGVVALVNGKYQRSATEVVVGTVDGGNVVDGRGVGVALSVGRGSGHVGTVRVQGVDDLGDEVVALQVTKRR